MGGDHPDGSPLRVGNEYYLTHSSFDYAPGLLIWHSRDLINWTPLADSDGKVLKVLSARPGYFDSWLVEAGPPAILTERGIVLVYNAGNSGQFGQPGLPQRVYTGGYFAGSVLNAIVAPSSTCRSMWLRSRIGPVR